MPSNAAYPQRSSHFAHSFCRLLARSEAAVEIGPEACWLLAVIVHKEDALRYQRPVTFWNSQLAKACGCSEDRMARARCRAVEAGWLHYQPGRKGIPGTYWVRVPEHISGFSSADSPANCGGKLDSPCGGKLDSSALTPAKQGDKADFPPHLHPQNNGASIPNTLINIPNPNKRYRGATKNKPKKERFRKPTLEEVKAYCNEAGLNIDPQAFWDYYEANGWVQGRSRKPIQNWKAAVRLWAQNEERWKHEQPSTTKRTSAGFR